MKKNTLFFISVIPLVHIPSSRETLFSYGHSLPIPIGSLVEIPLGKNRIVQGIVLASSQKSPREKNLGNIKSIRKILSPSLLTEKQIKFAQFISKEYFGSIGVVLRLFLTTSPKKNKLPEPPKKGAIESISLTDKQKEASEHILRSKKAIFLTGPPSSGKTEVLIDATRKILKKNKQVLLLLPEITLTSHTIKRMILRLGDGAVCVFHSDLPASSRALVSQRVASGESRVVVGSRSALFLPFQKLGLLIVDEEHDDSYKQTFKSPKYDARFVAEKLAEINQAKIVFCSSTPRSETLFRARNKTMDKLTLPSLSKKQKISTPTVQVIDMRLLHWKNKQKNMAPPIFSEELITRIYDTLKRKEQALLLVSRQGLNAFSLCSQCRNIFRCPKCDRALVSQRSGHFLCLGGHFRTPAFPRCPSCGGLHFIGHGTGTQKIEAELARIFPYAKTARLDSESSKKRSFRESVISAMSERKIDILIGTQMIAKGWDISHLSLIGVIDSDSFLTIPDYSTDTRTAQLFFQAKGRLNRFGSVSPGTLLLQTYHTEKPIFSFLLKDDYLQFLKEEMKVRKILHYPPYCRLLHIVGKHTNDALLKIQANALFKTISPLMGEHIFLSRPVKSFKHQKPGWFKRHLIMKYPQIGIPENIRKILENVPKNWYIDNDPVSFT